MTEHQVSWLNKHRESVAVGIVVFILTFAIMSATTPDDTNTQAKAESHTTQQTSKPINISKSGHGPTATEKVSLKKGLAIFKAQYNGGENVFVAEVIDSNGDSVGTITNEASAGSVSGSVSIPTDGQYLFDVNYLGDWTVTITQD